MEKLSLKKKFGGREKITNWRNRSNQTRPSIICRTGTSSSFIYFFKRKKKVAFNSTKILKREETSLKRIKEGLGEEKRATHGKPKKRDNKNDIYQTM